MTFISWLPAREGGDIIGEIFRDNVGSAVTGNITYSITGPGLAASGTIRLSFVGSGLPSIRIKVGDNSVVGDSAYTITGSLNVSGQTLTINQRGIITDNDNADFSVNLSSKSAAYLNIARLPSSATIPITLKDDPFADLFSTSPTLEQRFQMKLIDANVQMTTSVAVTAYQFFTGKIPSLAGLDFLVNPTVNTNSLNSPYYTAFNAENRYINFAANLGLNGEGAAKFAADYGPLSVNEAIRKAYIEIVGSANDSGIAAIQASTPYFAQVASERIGGNLDLATKAAAIGYILNEVVKADAGVYGRALENFYLDLSDGTAQTGVSLVGIYSAGSFVDGIA
jgi:hypothetical protein